MIGQRHRTQRQASARQKIVLRRGVWRQLIGTLACVCFFLRLLYLPLHLAQHEHVSAGAAPEHAHLHAHVHAQDAHGAGERQHGHQPDPTGHDDPRDEHRPHPIEDHLEPFGEPVAYSILIHSALNLAPETSGLPGCDLRPNERILLEESVPRPSPLRTQAAPRGPPILV